MKVQYVNLILSAVKEVFISMLGMAVIFNNPIRKQTEHPSYDVSSIIKIKGLLCGCIVLSYPKEMAVRVASEMLDENMTKINDDTVDAISEITNMVAGVADTELGSDDISYSLPSIAMDKHNILYPENSFICNRVICRVVEVLHSGRDPTSHLLDGGDA